MTVPYPPMRIRRNLAAASFAAAAAIVLIARCMPVGRQSTDGQTLLDAAAPRGERALSGAAEATASSASSRVAARVVGCWRLRSADRSAETAEPHNAAADSAVVCSAAAADGRPAVHPAVAATRGADAAPDYAYVSCFAAPPAASGTRIALASEAKTVEGCLRACADDGHAYAALIGDGVCLCGAGRWITRMLPDARCNTPCAGYRKALCGGRGAAAVYHLRTADGASEWTHWMVPSGVAKDGAPAVRFRGCLAINRPSDRRCTVDMQRRPGSLPRPNAAQTPLQRPPRQSDFIGCFGLATDFRHVTVEPNATAVSSGCLGACASRGFLYAFCRTPEGCSCSNTLGVSRPVAFCDGVHGIPFYFAGPLIANSGGGEHGIEAKPDDNGGADDGGGYQEEVQDGSDKDHGDGGDEDGVGDDYAAGVNDSDNEYANDADDAGDEDDDADDAGDSDDDADGEGYDDEDNEEVDEGDTAGAVELIFGSLPSNKRRVLLMAYHRSGSTYASEIVSKHPGALYIFEPDVIYSDHRAGIGEYDDVGQMHSEFFRAFERYVLCDVHRLPHLWMTLNSFFPRPFEHSPRMDAYIGCLESRGAQACAPLFQAHCEAASIVSAKTIRITATPQTAAFVRAHPSVVVLHLMRDPRAVMNSRKFVLPVTTVGARQLCENMQRTAQFINGTAAASSYAGGSRSAFNVHYENLVVAPVVSARLIYRDMLKLNITDAIVKRLKVISGQLDDGGPDVNLRLRYTTRKENPGLSLHKWKRQLTAQELRVVESSCASVISWYPQLSASVPALRRIVIRLPRVTQRSPQAPPALP